jgi:hypothetical protein
LGDVADELHCAFVECKKMGIISANHSGLHQRTDTIHETLLSLLKVTNLKTARAKTAQVVVGRITIKVSAISSTTPILIKGRILGRVLKLEKGYFEYSSPTLWTHPV